MSEHRSEQVYHPPPAANTTLRRVSDTLTRLTYQPWHFGDSVAIEAMLASARALPAPELFGFAHGFVRAWAAQHRTFVELDCTAPGHAILELYHQTSDPLLLESAVALATFLRSRRTVDGVFATWEQSPLREPYGPVSLSQGERALLQAPGAGVFIDCLHFDPPFFTQLGNVTHTQAWTDLGVAQAVGYVRLLRDEDTDLFHHFHLANTGQRYGPGWGRGQGWALLGLLDVLAAAPHHAQAPVLRHAVSRLINAMIATQRVDGHWDAVVGEGRSGLESSTAAFMSVGFRRAARLGLVSSDAVSPSAERALNAVQDSIDSSGVLQHVSAAVWASTHHEHYWHVPRGFVVPWGQGPAALALADAVMHGMEQGCSVAPMQESQVPPGPPVVEASR